VLRYLALAQLVRQGDAVKVGGTCQLTRQGRLRAQSIVRSHRLWESYVAKHFELPADHLHASAELAEHYIDPNLRDELASELHSPQADPHGRQIPRGTSEPRESDDEP
jgi:Mn-dependent DtxR family transcriptional regulator